MADIEYSKATITDSKGKVLKEPKKDKLDMGKLMWWKMMDDMDNVPETEVAGTILATLNFMAQRNAARIEQITVATRLYGNTSAFSLLGSSFTRASAVPPSPSSQRISYNLCSSVVDTLTSQIAKDKITPTFITSGGRWGMQRKAENLSKFIDGCFYENKIQKKRVEAFRDGAVWGDGFVHVYRTEDDRVGVERVLPHELLIDEIEALVATPRQLHRVKICDREVLKDCFKDVEGAAEKIDRAMPSNLESIAGEATAGDLITVSESWRLPSGPETMDGRKVICVGDQYLCGMVYEKDYFPFPGFQYSKRMLGWWGQGAVERLQNLQGEINRLMILIQKSMWLGGSFKILVPIGSKVVSQHLNNDVGAIIHYAGNVQPSYITPPMIQNDIYPYVDTLIERGYRQEGVSMLSASSMKPLGVNSGTALRTYDKIADDRQLVLGQGIEDFSLEIARQMIEVVKDIFKDKKTYKVTWPGTRFVESIDWKDVNLEDDEYYLKAFPTSSLPDDPMARLETIQEYMQAGMISPRAGRRLLRTEDIEMSDMLANAAEELICKTIESIIYDGEEAESPDGNWDLQLAKQLSIEYYNFALLNECPKENMNELRTWMSFIDDQMGLTTPPPPPMGAPGAPGGNAPSAPLANPMPTPQSDLVPNTAPAVSQ